MPIIESYSSKVSPRTESPNIIQDPSEGTRRLGQMAQLGQVISGVGEEVGRIITEKEQKARKAALVDALNKFDYGKIVTSNNLQEDVRKSSNPDTYDQFFQTRTGELKSQYLDTISDPEIKVAIQPKYNETIETLRGWTADQKSDQIVRNAEAGFFETVNYAETMDVSSPESQIVARAAIYKAGERIKQLNSPRLPAPEVDMRVQQGFQAIEKKAKVANYQMWRNKLLSLSDDDYGKELDQSGLDTTEKRRIHWERVSSKAVNDLQEQTRQQTQKSEIRSQMEKGNVQFDDIEKIGTDLPDATKDSLRKELSDRSKPPPEKTDYSKYAEIEKDVLDAQTGAKIPGVVEDRLIKARFVDRQINENDYQELSGRLKQQIPAEMSDAVKEAFSHKVYQKFGWPFATWPLKNPSIAGLATDIVRESTDYLQRDKEQADYRRSLFAWLESKKIEKEGKVSYDVTPTDIYTKSRELAVFARSGGISGLSEYGLERFLGAKTETVKAKETPTYKVPVGEDYKLPDGRLMGTYSADGTVKLNREGITIFFEEMIRGDWNNPKDVERAKKMAKDIGFILD